MKRSNPFNTVLSALFALIAIFISRVPALGASYPVINATTAANLSTQDAKAVEELWTRKVVLGADYVYQDNPLADGFMGEGDAGKAIVKMTDTEKVHGNTINVTTFGGFGGPGSQGSDDRIGNEQKIQIGSFPVKIGRYWFGVGFQSVARDETMLGTGRLDGMIVEGLRQLHAQKRNDDMIRLLIAHADANGRNNSYTVGGPTTVAGIRTAHYVDTPTITNTRNKLAGNGAMPMAVGPKDSGGSRPMKFVFFSTHHGLSHLDYESDYTSAQREGGERGANNNIFKGNYSEWSSVGIYRWYQKDHGNAGPIGSLLAPRMYLSANMPTPTFSAGSWAAGGTISNSSTSYVDAAGASATLNPGIAIAGNAANADINTLLNTPYPDYTRYFSNAPWKYHWGDTIAAASTQRYVMIISQSGANAGKYAVFGYTANSGKNIALTTAVLTTAGSRHPDGAFLAGDLVVECNASGVPLGRSVVFGKEALICGVGTINGSRSNPQFGRRTEEHRNHDLDHAIGAEAVWGAAIVKRADNVAPGFLVVNHALPVDSAPVIT